MPEIKSENGPLENMKQNQKLWIGYIESEDEKEHYKADKPILSYPKALF
jgi:hypothetical protein